MIHELRTYTLTVGSVPEFLKLGQEEGLPVRGDICGKLVGFWFTEFDTLNQVTHIWAHEDLNARQAGRARLAQCEPWMKDFVPKIIPMILKQDITFLTPVHGVVPPAEEGNIYELRSYRLKVGQAPAFAQRLKDILPVREKYSKNVAIWTCEAPEPNTCVHLWAYKDLNAREEARAKVAQDPDWLPFAAQNREVLENMHSVILKPAAVSPLK